MKLHTDLPRGLHRARWLNGIERHGFVYHKFHVVGHGEVLIPDRQVKTADGETLHTDCNAELNLHFSANREVTTRNGRAFTLRYVTVQRVPA